MNERNSLMRTSSLVDDVDAANEAMPLGFDREKIGAISTGRVALNLDSTNMASVE